MAHKADNPSVSGIIPLTHVRLVYMSDDDDNDNDDFELVRLHDDYTSDPTEIKYLCIIH